MESLTLDAAGVAELLAYISHRKTGARPNRALVYTLTRDGKLPAPIDASLPPAQWRWSRRKVEAYIDTGDIAS